jgi:hypothetical protein
MKISDIIKNVDRSDKNSDQVSWDDLMTVFELINYGWCETPKIKCYRYACWQCTDTWVGGKVYFYEDEAFAVSWQPYRKSDEDFKFISREMFEKVRKYIQDLMIDNDEIKIDLVDLDEEIGDGYQVEYSSQFLTKDVIFIPTNEDVKVSKTWGYYNEKDHKKWKKVEIEKSDGTKEIVDLSDILIPYNLTNNG